MFLRYYEEADDEDDGYDAAAYGLEGNDHCWIDEEDDGWEF